MSVGEVKRCLHIYVDYGVRGHSDKLYQRSRVFYIFMRKCGVYGLDVCYRWIVYVLCDELAAVCVFKLELNFHSGSSIYSSQCFAV